MSRKTFAITGAIEAQRLVKKDSSNNTVSYATENGFDAIGVTSNAVSTAAYAAGIDIVSVDMLKDSPELRVEFAGAVTEGSKVGVGATGLAKALADNATPVATNIVGFAKETGGGANSNSFVLIDKGNYTF